MSDKEFSNIDKPIIFSVLDLDTDYSKKTDDLFFNYFISIYGLELNSLKNRLSQYKKQELQKAINYIYNKIKKEKGICNLEFIGLVVYYTDIIKDEGKNIKNKLKALNIDINFADFFFAIYWCEIEFIYKTLKTNQELVFKSNTKDKLTAMAIILSIVKQSSFSFTLGREERLRDKTDNFVDDIKEQSNAMILNSFIAGGESRNTHEKSKGGKARADKYKSVKEYITKEYQVIQKASPKISNNKAVHTIISKMYKENFNYSPLTEYSRVDTLRKWVAKIKKGENL